MEGSHGAAVSVLGSANLDVILEVARRPGGGETVLASSMRTAPGGKGANQAVAAARLAPGVSFIGCLGSDAGGSTLRDSLAGSGVALDGVRTVPAPTGTAIITLTPDGENSIVVAPAANSLVDEALIDDTSYIWARPNGVLVMQLEIPLRTVAYAARRASAAGTRVLLNAAPAAPLDSAVLAVANPFVVNLFEAQQLLERVSNKPRELATALLGLGCRSVVVTAGADGSVAAVPGSDPVHIAAYDVVPVDTTGAGDAFIGALATELARQVTLDAAVEFATAVSALAVQVGGAQPSFPTRQVVAQFLAGPPARRAPSGRALT